MTRKVRVAAVSNDAKPGRTADNLESIADACRLAASDGTELALFPELSVTGFIPNHPHGDHSAWLREVLGGAWAMAQPLDGQAVTRLREISYETGVFIAAGLLENAGNLLYNTHVLVGQGRLLGFWRKMHIPLFEMQVYNGGGVPDVVDTTLGRIGANICFDAFLPESTRLLAIRNAEIVLFPFAADPEPRTPAGWAAWAGPVLRARCVENGVFGVACNYRADVSYAGVNQSFPGGAMIVCPDGTILAESSETAPLGADLLPDALHQARSRFEYTYRFRRPELYGTLAQRS